MNRRQQRGGSPAFAVLLALTILFAAFAAFAQVEIVIPRCSPIETYTVDEPCGAHSPWTPPVTKLRDWGTANWTTKHTLEMAGYGVLRLYDTAQSRTIAKNPDKWKEVGPISSLFYGEHPSVAAVHRFNLLAFLGVWLVAYNLDTGRSGWLWGNIAVEAYTVNSNRKIGLKPDWPLFGAAFRW